MASIRVMSGGAPKDVFARLVPQFEWQSGHKVNFVYGVISSLREKIAAGETADVLVMPVSLLDGYQKDGTLRGGARVTFGTVLISMAVREGAPIPDISTPQKLREALMAARAVVHATPGKTPSGTHMGKVVEELKLGPGFASKMLYRPALDGGVDLVAKGEADLGFYPTSEIVNIAGLTVAAPLPADLQLPIVYGAGVTTRSSAPYLGVALLKFLSDPVQRKFWKISGFEPAN